MAAEARLTLSHTVIRTTYVVHAGRGRGCEWIVALLHCSFLPIYQAFPSAHRKPVSRSLSGDTHTPARDAQPIVSFSPVWNRVHAQPLKAVRLRAEEDAWPP